LTVGAATGITHGRRHAIENMNILLRALDYAADRHRNQRRKDLGQTPYVNHLIAVADLLANVGGVSDPAVLAAAVLHDVVEDAGVTNAEVERLFGPDVAALVAEVTDDKSLDKQERKRRQVEHAPHLTLRAKLIKMADKIANVTDVIQRPPATWNRRRCTEYLAWSAEVVAGCRGANAGLERRFDEALEQGQARYPERH
jgi:GTP diphosphokinase / guanosine-3',5'-bis(diphosphate) 3'-diphosphatase